MIKLNMSSYTLFLRIFIKNPKKESSMKKLLLFLTLSTLSFTQIFSSYVGSTTGAGPVINTRAGTNLGPDDRPIITGSRTTGTGPVQTIIGTTGIDITPKEVNTIAGIWKLEGLPTSLKNLTKEQKEAFNKKISEQIQRALDLATMTIFRNQLLISDDQFKGIKNALNAYANNRAGLPNLGSLAEVFNTVKDVYKYIVQTDKIFTPSKGRNSSDVVMGGTKALAFLEKLQEIINNTKNALKDKTINLKDILEPSIVLEEKAFDILPLEETTAN